MVLCTPQPPWIHRVVWTGRCSGHEGPAPSGTLTQLTERDGRRVRTPLARRWGMPTGSVLIVTWDGGGNVRPALALGARLVAAGHRTRLLATRSIEPRALAAGLTFSGFDSVPTWPEGVAMDDDGARFEAMLNGPEVA